MLVSNHPEDAAEIVRRASNGEGLLSNDGASVGNLVSGDAVRSYITMATIKDKTHGLGQSDAFYSFFVSPTNYMHSIVLAISEIIKEYIQAGAPGASRDRSRSCIAGCRIPIARAATNVLLRSLGTSLVMEEMYRGTPVIYVDYTDYDEIAHHSGPERAETLDALDGVDTTIASLAARRTQDAPAVPLHRPLGPRPEPRLDVPAALRQDPPGRHRGADGRPRRGANGDGGRRGLGPAERLPVRGPAGQGRDRGAHPGHDRRPDEGRGRDRGARGTHRRRGRGGARDARTRRVRLRQPGPHLLPPALGSGLARDARGHLSRRWSTPWPTIPGSGCSWSGPKRAARSRSARAACASWRPAK